MAINGRAKPVVAEAPVTGVFAPVLTPFRTDLSPDAERFVGHCRWLLAEGAGLAPFGTTSEATSLAVDERIELLERLLSAGVDPARVMPGTGCSAITDSVRLTTHAVTLGCAGVLMLPPFYYKGVSNEGLFRSFAEVIERVGDSRLRIHLYNIPAVSQVPITVALIERLVAAYPRVVVGVKDSSGEWETTESYIDNFASQGFRVFPGSETFLLKALRHGGAGCISATANLNPGAMARLHATWRAEDANEQQERLDRIRGILGRYPLIPALKVAIAHYRGDSGWETLRPPLVELAAGKAATLIRDLDDAGFTFPQRATAA